MADVCGIDPSFKSGFVALNFDGSVVDTKHLKFKDEKGCRRLHLIAQSIGSLLESHQPTVIVIEALGFANKFTKVEMAQVGILIRMECWRLNLPWWDVPPTVLKKWTTGKGNALKGGMAVSVQSRWGFTSKSDDVVDAYALAQMGRYIQEHGAEGFNGVHQFSN